MSPFGAVLTWSRSTPLRPLWVESGPSPGPGIGSSADGKEPDPFDVSTGPGADRSERGWRPLAGTSRRAFGGYPDLRDRV